MADLFNLALVHRYVDDNPRFIARPWLAERLATALDDADCRFVLLTAEPGAGKTAFMAWLAWRHPEWPRYFIRRDQRSPLDDANAHSFLLSVGLQFAAVHPAVFDKDQVTVSVEQRFGMVADGGDAVGAEVARLLASPFHQTAVRVRQLVEDNHGRVAGLQVGEWVTDPRLLALGDLQFMALLDPAESLLRARPDERMVILVDALDEVRYRDTEGTVLGWLATCPEVPPNVRFILTSRADDALLARFRGAQRPWFRELTLAVDDAELRADLQTYASRLTDEPKVRAALTAPQRLEAFIGDALTKANGNIGYLDAVGRAVDQAVAIGDDGHLERTLDLSSLPDRLEGLYAFFLHQVKEVVGGRSVVLEDPQTGEVRYLSAWPTVHQRVLGVLSVAHESLTLSQIEAMGGIGASPEYLTEAVEHLRQFLDRDDKTGRYRLYHATLAEFLTAESTRDDPAVGDLYQDAVRWHRRIVAHYRHGAPAWAEVDWKQVDDYGLRNLTQHLHALRADAAHREDLFALICKPLMVVKQVRTLSHQSFAMDLELALDAALSGIPRCVAQATRFSLLRATLRTFSTNIPSDVLAALARVGEGEKALGYASLLSTADRQRDAYVRIGEEAAAAGDDAVARKALRLASSAAEVAGCDDATLEALLRLRRILLVADDGAGGAGSRASFQLEPTADREGDLPALATELAGVAADRGVEAAVAGVDGCMHVMERVEVLHGMVAALADQAEFGKALAIVERMPGGADAVAQARQGYTPEEAGYYAMEIGFAAMRLEAALFQGQADALQDVIAKAARQADSTLLEKAIAASQGIEHDELAIQRKVAYALSGSDAPAPNEAAGRRIEVHDRRAGALASLAQALATVGDVELAETVAHAIPDPSAHTEASRRIAQALAGAGSGALAIQVIERLPEAEARAAAIREVATAWTARSSTGDLRRLCALAAGIADERARVRAQVAIGLAMVEQSDPGGLNEVAAQMTSLVDPQSRAEGLAAVANLSAHIGVSGIPVQMFADALTMADEWARAEAISGVAQALAVLDERDRVAAAVEAVAGIREDGARANALRGILPALLRTKDLAGVRRAFSYVRGFSDESILVDIVGGPRLVLSYDPRDVIHTLYRLDQRRLGLAQAFARLGFREGTDKCLDIARGIQDGERRQQALIGVLIALARCSPDDAIRQFRARAADIRDPSGAAEILVAAAEFYAERADADGLDRVLSEGALLENPEARATVVAELARRYAQISLVEGVRRALGIAEETFTFEAAKADAVLGVAKAAALVGQESMLRRALTCAASVSYEPPRARALGGVASAAAEAGAAEIVSDAITRALALLEDVEEESNEVRTGVMEAVAGMMHHLAGTTDPTTLRHVVGAIRAFGPEFRRIRGSLEEGRSGIIVAASLALAATHDMPAFEELRTMTESLSGCDEYTYASVGIATALARMNMLDVAMEALSRPLLRAAGEGRGCLFEVVERIAGWLADRSDRELLHEVATGVLDVESWWS